MSNRNTYHALPVLGGPGVPAAAARGPGARGQAPPPPPPAPRLFPAGRTNHLVFPAQPLPAQPLHQPLHQPFNPIGNNNNNNAGSTGTLEATELMPNETQITNNTGLNPYVGETTGNAPPSNATTGGRRKRRMSRKGRVSRKRKVSRRKSKKTSRK